MPHFIRLRGPWSYSPVARWVRNAEENWRLAADSLPNGATISLPGDWSEVLGENFAGSVQFTRTFRCPEALATATCVWLTIEDVGWSAKVELNDQMLGEIAGSHADECENGQGCPARFDITHLLKPRNLLAITVTSQPQTTTEGRCGHLGLVRLEIE